MAFVPALLVMHGSLGEALLAAAERLYGPIGGIDVLSNEGLSRAALEAEIARRVEGWPAGGLVLTDIWGGSCHTCGMAASRGRPVVIVTGVNLPTLLDYLHNRDGAAVDELAERLLKKGQDSIRVQRGLPE